MSSNIKPSIRFKKYDSENVKTSLNTICDIYDGVHETPNYVKKGIMFLSVEDIKTLHSNKFITQEDFKNNFNIYPEYGDIFLTRIGDIGTPSVFLSNEKMGFYVSLALLKNIKINNFYLSYIIQSSNYKKELFEHSLLTAIPQKINKDEIGKTNIYYCINKAEQEKIGYFLRNIDKVIELTKKKVNILDKYKLSLLNKMIACNNLAPEIRYRQFDSIWSSMELSSICSISKGTQLNLVDMISNGLYYVQNGGTSPSGFTNSYNTNENTISISEGGNSCGYIQFNKNKFWSGGHNYTLLNVKINNEFLYYCLKNSQQSIMDMRVGTGLPNIQKSSLNNFVVNYSENKGEQAKIGKLFYKFDDLISLYELKITKLEMIKKSLLDKMFI